MPRVTPGLNLIGGHLIPFPRPLHLLRPLQLSRPLQLTSLHDEFRRGAVIIRLVRKAESNRALRSKLDILVSVRQLTTAGNSREKYVLRKDVDSVYNLARIEEVTEEVSTHTG
jgi:hypothetical protein